MRLDNVVLTTLGVFSFAVATSITWRGRDRRVIVPVASADARTAASNAVRSLAACLSAAVLAGVLVPGIGGRLVMRVLAATSGDMAQGRLTEAEERVGEITFGGSLSFVIFAGIVAPIFLMLVYVIAREVLPDRALVAGAIFGLALLGSVGVADPLSPDNIDFRILSPRWLAVTLVSVTALLFGTTAAILANRFEAVLQHREGRRWQRVPLYVPLAVLGLPLLLVVAAAYVAGRALARGRVRSLLDDHRPIVLAGRLVQASAVVLSLVSVAGAAAEIL